GTLILAVEVWRTHHAARFSPPRARYLSWGDFSIASAANVIWRTHSLRKDSITSTRAARIAGIAAAMVAKINNTAAEPASGCQPGSFKSVKYVEPARANP